jgi:hypothetical protein
MSEIHQWKMIIHEHCRLVSPRVLHKKRRRLWSGAVMIMYFGRLGSRVCLLVSNSGAGCCSSIFFWCWANFECPHMKLICPQKNIDVSYIPWKLTHVGWMHDSCNSLPPQAWAQFLLRMVGLAWSSVQLYLLECCWQVWFVFKVGNFEEFQMQLKHLYLRYADMNIKFGVRVDPQFFALLSQKLE